MIIAAAAVGTAIAGLILYFRKNESDRHPIKNAAKNAYKTMNDGLGKIERRGQHAVG